MMSVVEQSAECSELRIVHASQRISCRRHCSFLALMA
jgi:hypothetical protein